MEHKTTTRAVLARYLRRRWKRPAKLAAAGYLLLLLIAFGPFPGIWASQEPARESTARVAGEVESLRSRGVGPLFDGPLLSMQVREGQRVRKGQLLFRMDIGSLQSSLADARTARSAAAASLAEARASERADLADLEARLSSLKRSLAREHQAVAALMYPPAAAEAEESPDEAPAGAAEEGPLPDAAPIPEPAVPGEPAKIEGLRAQLAEARSRWQERKQVWAPSIMGALEALHQAGREVGRLEALIREANRRSPMDGVVTALYAEAGEQVFSHTPVVRVDDPAGYRIVTFVDRKVRARVAPGASLPVVGRNGQYGATLEKIVAGWDHNAFYYWLWMRPAAPDRLAPGQRVEIALGG